MSEERGHARLLGGLLLVPAVAFVVGLWTAQPPDPPKWLSMLLGACFWMGVPLAVLGAVLIVRGRLSASWAVVALLVGACLDAVLFAWFMAGV